MIKRIGILTGGGDCPGLNPAIRGVAMKAFDYSWEVLGIQEGWRGMVEGVAVPLSLRDVEDIIVKGGTILGSSRTNPYKDPAMVKKCHANFKSLGLDALVALGGEDTLGVANKLFKDGFNVVGVPKTMDNDLNGTDYTFGFDTAVSLAANAAMCLKDTAESHRRVMVFEVMGRHAGWVALYTAITCGADWVTIPEIPVNLEEMCEHLKKVRARGKKYSIVVISEGSDIKGLSEVSSQEQKLDAFGHMILKERNLSETLAKEIEKRTGFETRTAVIGHMQRGGTPTTFDRILGTKVGVKAAEMVKEGKFGYMAAMRGSSIIAVPLEEALKSLKTVPLEEYELAKVFFK